MPSWAEATLLERHREEAEQNRNVKPQGAVVDTPDIRLELLQQWHIVARFACTQPSR
jgi:hypothetical protein